MTVLKNPLLLFIFLIGFHLCTLAQTDSSLASYPAEELLKDSLSTDGYYRINKTFLKSVITDFPKVASSPLRFSRRDWRTVGLVVAGTGALLVADRGINQLVQRNKSGFLTQTANLVEPFGNKYSPYIMGALYVTGVLIKDRKMEHVALITGKSLVYSTIFYISSKQIVRRRRPSYTDDPFEVNSIFQGGREWTSFPSGHGNTVFTVATAIALQYRDKKWVPPIAYGIATLTGLSRIYDNRHWASDVLVGAAMGHFITKALYKVEMQKIKKSEGKQLQF